MSAMHRPYHATWVAPYHLTLAPCGAGRQEDVMSSEQLVAHGTVRGVFFSLGTTPSHDPRLDCAKAIIDLFNAAQKTAHVAIFTLTERHIVDAMIAARKRGVAVEVVADAQQSRSPSNPVQKQMIAKL